MKEFIFLQQMKLSQHLLNVACRKGHIEIVKLLLANKEVDFHSKNKYGEPAIKIARRMEGYEKMHLKTKNYRDILEILESFERNPDETRTKLRMQLRSTDGDAASIYWTIVLLSDHYLVFKKN